MFFSSESHFMQQSCIIHQMETRDCIVVISLLVHFCQSRLVGPNKPIIATGGEDITLPCHLVPGENVAEMTFEWTRPDLEPRFVFVWRTRQDLVAMKNPSYKDRSSLFTDELKHGNISLKLSKVKPADEGRYRCFIPAKDEEAFIDLVVVSGAVSSPVISLEGIDRDKTGVVLQCESAGWYPEPELLWLDGEGNLLSAGPTETLRGPDDLYTVSSRVTVEKRHSNNITCRVQQRNTNQSRETHIHVSDELFQLTSSSTAPIIIGVVVSLAVIILILIGVFFLWRRNKKKKKNPFKGDQTETDQEQQTLMTQNIKPEEKPETNKKLKEDEKQDFQQEKQTDVKVVNPKSPHEHESPRRTNTGTIETLTQTRAKDSPGGGHSAGTEQKPQESVAMSSQAQPADGCTRADRPLSPETQDPRAPHTPTGAYQSQGGQAQPTSCQEQKQEADKKMKEDEKQDFQQEVKQPSIKERMKQFEENQQSPPDIDTPRKTTTGKIKTPTQMRAKDSPGGGHPPDTEQKPHRSVAMSSQAQLAVSCTRADRRLSPETQDPRAHHIPTGARQSQGVQARPSSRQEHLEKNQHAAEEKLKEEHHHLQKKHAEISNMKKEPETSKHKTHPNSKNKSFQEQNKSSSANHSSVRGDIILDKVDKLGQYICLKNTSSENKLMGDWEVKLQVNETQPVTYRVEKNFTLKAGERLTLHRVGARSPYPDDAEMGWMGMTDWEIGDDLKISLISNTGEEHRLK
ncbi:uncharacterized protein LOC120438900 isoform X2 [Oreochromis aureus]|uniref:uncharacterized protein LOC120438900 isoform X2 n=1 Tax=Oreochromis aureus TaxID=47969 RepID=UPI001953A571|nr:uncharacterized protein LOC120438900 isoform X2 [Oreochromis aureus]